MNPIKRHKFSNIFGSIYETGAANLPTTIVIEKKVYFISGKEMALRHQLLKN
jgi:hypothetical protein